MIAKIAKDDEGFVAWKMITFQIAKHGGLEIARNQIKESLDGIGNFQRLESRIKEIDNDLKEEGGSLEGASIFGI